jgi:molybdate transport system ATP-binding protein
LTVLEVRLRLQRGEFAVDAQFTTPTPGITALYGRSGAGKTTLIHLLAGLLEADSGLFALDGEKLFDSATRVNVPAHRRRVGCVFQDLRLFPHLDVAGNLGYGLRRCAPQPQRITMARIVALLDLDSLLGRRTWQLSGGERQRVALGRALLAQPRLLLLDEPLAAIDAAKRDEVLPYFARLRDELALPMVLVTHHFEDVVRLATHVVLLDRGRVQAQGSLPEVSLVPELSALLGTEGVGAVVEGRVESIDSASGLAKVSAGRGHLLVPADGLEPGGALRLQLLARDLILATAPPVGLSVRNQLQAVITDIKPEAPHNVMVSLDAGGLALLARVTTAAALDLQLRVGQHLWVLIKAVSLRGRAR